MIWMADGSRKRRRVTTTKKEKEKIKKVYRETIASLII